MERLEPGQRVRVLNGGLSERRGQLALAVVRAVNAATEMVTVTLESGLPGQTIVVPRARIAPIDPAVDPVREREQLVRHFTLSERARLEFTSWLVLTGRLAD
jgi:hypothetical protein